MLLSREFKLELKLLNQLGSEFIRVVDNNLALIQKSPFAYPIIHDNIHRKLLPRFPSGLFYLIQDNIIFVLALGLFSCQTRSSTIEKTFLEIAF